MADVFSKRKRSEVMSLIRGSGNKGTELALVQIFRAHRITGWRRHQAMFGKPDFVFAKIRLAVFVDGCFWHYCPSTRRSLRPMLRSGGRNLRPTRLVTGWLIRRFGRQGGECCGFGNTSCARGIRTVSSNVCGA